VGVVVVVETLKPVLTVGVVEVAVRSQFWLIQLLLRQHMRMQLDHRE
jgi:hypothetical protein